MKDKSENMSLFARFKVALAALAFAAAVIAGGTAVSEAVDTPDAQETEVARGLQKSDISRIDDGGSTWSFRSIQWH